MERRVFLSSLCAAALVSVVGCGPKAPYDLVPIAGTVTYKGQPLDDRFHIQFVPNDGTRASMSKLDSKGNFEAVHTPSQKGVKPGTCTVEIYWNENPQVVPIPEEYTEMFEKYGFTGSDKMTVEIKGKNKKMQIAFE